MKGEASRAGRHAHVLLRERGDRFARDVLPGGAIRRRALDGRARDRAARVEGEGEDGAAHQRPGARARRVFERHDRGAFLEHPHLGVVREERRVERLIEPLLRGGVSLGADAGDGGLVAVRAGAAESDRAAIPARDDHETAEGDGATGLLGRGGRGLDRPGGADLAGERHDRPNMGQPIRGRDALIGGGGRRETCGHRLDLGGRELDRDLLRRRWRLDRQRRHAREDHEQNRVGDRRRGRGRDRAPAHRWP